MISPIVEGILGIAPRAAERRLTVIPNLPTGWEHAALKHIRVGDARFDVTVEKSASHYAVAVAGNNTDYQIEIGAYLPENARVSEVTLNNQATEWDWKETRAGQCVVCTTPMSAVLIVRWKD